MISKILSRVMGVLAALMLLPVVTALWYGESPASFLYTMGIAAALAVLLALPKLKRKDLYAREGFVSVALAWLLISLVGALPFVFAGEIPHYVDAFFEIVSGFTTTGSSILTDVEAMSHGHLLWRSLSHWIGGMGVLVFIMAVVPLSEERSMHIMRAEVPGPVVGKLVPRIRHSSAITYLIYVVLTVILIILLCAGGMPFFDSVNHSMATAGTGGLQRKSALHRLLRQRVHRHRHRHLHDSLRRPTSTSISCFSSANSAQRSPTPSSSAISASPPPLQCSSPWTFWAAIMSPSGRPSDTPSSRSRR